MTTYPNYTRNPGGTFSKDNAFSQVVVGTGSMLLEDELNEMQALQKERLQRLYDRQDVDGLKSIIQMTRHPTLKHLWIIPPFDCQVNGQLLRVAGWENDGQVSGVSADSNLVTLEVPTKYEHPRIDLLYLEIKEEAVHGYDPIFQNGMKMESRQIANRLIDPRAGQETARRMQRQAVLRLYKGAPNAGEWNSVSVLGEVLDPEGCAYVYERNGRWRSANQYTAIPLAVVQYRKSGRPPHFSYSTSVYFHTPKYQLAYDEYYDLTQVDVLLGNVLLERFTVGYTDNRISSVTRLKDGRETKYSLGWDSDDDLAYVVKTGD